MTKNIKGSGWVIREEWVEPKFWEETETHMYCYGYSETGEKILVAMVNKKAAEKLLGFRKEMD